MQTCLRFVIAVWVGLAAGCAFDRGNPVGLPEYDASVDFKQIFEAPQIIGEGADFLTLKCDVPSELVRQFDIYALAIDESGYPLRKVSSYTHAPMLAGRDHLWFFFLLYDPVGSTAGRQKSHHVEFIVVREDTVIFRQRARLKKQWGSPESRRIYDLPAPPDNIEGYLVIGDYTFLAVGDYRKPTGAFLKGRLLGSQGRWLRFRPCEPLSGAEPQPDTMAFEMDRGWIELTNGAAYSISAAKTPVEPYIEGWWDAKGWFHPQPFVIRGIDPAQESGCGPKKQ